MMKNNGYSYKKEETSPKETERPLTSVQMCEALQILCCGVHHGSASFQMQCECEEFINNLH